MVVDLGLQYVEVVVDKFFLFFFQVFIVGNKLNSKMNYVEVCLLLLNGLVEEVNESDEVLQLLDKENKIVSIVNEMEDIWV